MMAYRHDHALVLAALTLLIATATGEAAASRKRHPAQVTTSREIENETTGTLPAKAPPRQVAGTSATTSADDEALPPPFHLPTAPRKRMRDCGLKWQAMKMSGAAGDDIWRTFATHCLAAASGPLDDKHPDR